MPPAGFEPAIPASERSNIALDARPLGLPSNTLLAITIRGFPKLNRNQQVKFLYTRYYVHWSHTLLDCIRGNPHPPLIH